MQQRLILIVVMALMLILVNSVNIKAVNINTTNDCEETITINNEVLDPNPVFYGESLALIAKINGTNISNVWLESNFKGFLNLYYNESHVLDLYSFTIPSYDLSINQFVIWRYKASNNCGAVTIGNLQSFLVLGTSLTTNPLNPDGNNGWFRTLPLVSLSYNNIGDTYYGFDVPNVFYVSEFIGADDQVTGGISTIKYYSIDDSGRVEPTREFVTKVDFTNPSISHEVPEANSITNSTPLIKATIREIYQGNSGLNDASLVLMLDGNILSHEYIYYDINHAEVKYQLNEALINGTHNLSLYIEDNAANSNLKEWSFFVNNDLFEIELSSPIDSGIYNKKRVNFDIFIDKIIQKLELGVNDKYSNLCNNCNFFNKARTLKEGLNNLTIRGFNYGNMNEVYLNVFVDTVKPKIKKTEPKGNQVTNGTFRIVYSEDNLKEINLFWKNTGSNDFNKVNLENCEAGNNKECIITIDLGSIEGGKVDYYFEVKDDINNVISRIIEDVDVDTIDPEINLISPSNQQYGNKVPFEINISEEASLSYIDLSSRRPVYRSLCRNCESFTKVMTIGEGNHTIYFRAVDKAGNSDINQVALNILE